MKRKHYDEASVVKSLNKKKGLIINTSKKQIDIDRNSTDIGNGSWGKIDYLCKVHGYVCLYWNGVYSKKKKNDNKDDNDTVIDNKVAKRERKFNMAAMSKAAMRKAKSK